MQFQNSLFQWLSKYFVILYVIGKSLFIFFTMKQPCGKVKVKKVKDSSHN
jgi:hypothetical protein